MEHEELEQIPWSALVAEVDDGPHRRWFLVAGVVGALLAVYLAMRLLGAGGQPDSSGHVAQSTSTSSTAVSSADVVISEDDLRAEPIVSTPALSATQVAAIARAEWFVTDWFTRDGSPATDGALAEAVVRQTIIPPMRDESKVTFVEWAKAVRIENAPDGHTVTVAYRQISSTDGAPFERHPVAMVTVRIAFDAHGVPLVADPPHPAARPWGESG